MPARDPSATPMAHLSLPSSSARHHSHQNQQQHHLESGFAGGAGRRLSTASEPRPVFPAGSKSTDVVDQQQQGGHDPDTGRSHSISTPTTGAGAGGRRKSLWQSISSGIASANGQGHGNGNGGSNGPTRRTSEESDHAGQSGVSSQGSGVQQAAAAGGGGGSGWFSIRDDESMHSDDALYSAATTSEEIRNASMGLAASLSYSSSHSNPLHKNTTPRRRSSGNISEQGEDYEDGGEDEGEGGLQTIKESSRSSSAANLRTPRANPAAPLAGLPDDEADNQVDANGTEAGDGDDTSPLKHDGSLGSASNLPSGLSVMLSRSSASPGASPNKRSTLAAGGGTDQLASGASGAVGALLGPAMDALEESESPASETDKDTGSSVASSVTVRPAKTGKRATSPQHTNGAKVSSTTTTTERTPLLQHSAERNGVHIHNASTHHGHGGGNGNGKPSPSLLDSDAKPPTITGRLQQTRENVQSALVSLRKATLKDVAREVVVEPVKLLPATVLGCLLNVLDGVSYGMIMFPASPVFDNFGSLGVSMFFVSCIVSQLTYTLGGSIFKGGNGSMMIEAVPFFHILTNIITDEVGDDPSAIISTTMISYAFSAVLTGLVFLSLGYFRLGALIGYFPRHILVGCIGGVGVFLLETGLEVSRGLKEEGFEYNLNTLKVFFANGHAIALWTIPLALAIILRIITHKFHHQLIFPSYFFIIPCVFYIVVLIGGWKIGHLRQTGWIFDVGGVSQPWYTFYTLFDLHKFNWKAFWACIPTQMALVFFGILHVPLNVPALGVSLQEDNVDLDRELVAHGISNMGAGLLGTVPNYLCYVNTVLFYRVGGGSRLSGLMLAGATAVIMSIGPSVVAYLPVMVVGALIFVLGIDLVKEAVWDTRHRVNRMEYITIWAITIGMTVFDFVIGLLLGIILASMFFVIQNSRRKPIRAVFSGASAKSTVRRPHPQREFLQAVGKQTLVMKLQGFLFFGTITKVEEEIRKLLDLAAWESNPIRFLIVDFALVPGLDFSAAEAFVRLQRLLSQKDVLLILCGANPDGLVGRALQAVDLWADQEGTRVEVFDGLNSALEWCENAYLTAYYSSTAMARKENPTTHNLDFPKVSKPPFAMSEAFHNSPRRTHVTAAGVSNLPDGVANSPNHLAPVSGEHKTGSSKSNHGHSSGSSLTLKQPLPILLQTFSDYFDDPEQNPHDFFYNIVPYLSPVHTKAGETIWERDEMADALYLIESGCLRATYEYEDHCELIQETMVAGTVAGELTMLSASKRNATVVAERDSKLWKLDQKGLEKMEKERPEIARRFVKIVLKVANEEADVLFNHLVAVLS